MGNLTNQNKPQITMIGFDAVGKTTILNQLKMGKVQHLDPLFDFRYKKLETNQFDILSWNIGKSQHNRFIWKHYFKHSKGLIIVLNIADKDRIQQVKTLLQSLLIEDEYNRLPLLIFVNKIDLPQINFNEFVSEFKFENLSNNFHVQPCCAIRREGLQAGFKWILQQMAPLQKN